MQSPTWIAELRVVLVHPDGRRVPGHIAIGQPYALGGGDPAEGCECKCPIEVDSLYTGAHAISGEGSLQALLLGVQVLATVLQGFLSRGGRVVSPDDDADVPLEVFFGPMLRKTGS